MKNKIKITPLSKISSMIFKIGLPIITLVFLYILFTVLSATEDKRAWSYASAYTMLEYAIMSFTIIICGALAADTAEKYDK